MPVAPTSDRRAIGTGRWLLWKLLRAIWTLVGALPFRTRATGTETLPAQGAYLLLANHTSTFDTLWVAHPIVRPAHFMTSAALFRSPVARVLLPLVGAFPKEVGARDVQSAKTMQALCDAGQIVQIMPEGVRTWDGRLMPVGEGIGRLVKRLGCPVVVCRVETGHLWWPRWATWPRWVPLRMHFSPPMTWESEVEPGAIRDAIVEAMTPGPVSFAGVRTWAFRPAEGLPTYLWACPRCAVLGPEGVGERLSCAACGAVWRVTVDNQLVGVDGAPDLALSDAYDQMLAHFGTPMVQDRDRFESDGVALEDPDVTLFKLARGAPIEEAGRGSLVLRAEGLALSTGWTLGFDAVLSMNMDAGNVLHLRTEACIWRLAPADGSTFKWENFLRSWRS